MKTMIMSFGVHSLISGTLLFLLGFPALVLGEITEAEAIKFASEAILRFGVKDPQWTARVDKAGEVWRVKRAKWLDKRNPAVRERVARDVAEIESTFKDRKVWAIIYDRVVPHDAPPGTVFFDTEAIVFVDSDTGAVLSLINQEGGFETYIGK
jgi:hypothetical protein